MCIRDRTDTATIIGEINGSSTLSETPSPAMTKANSPICARLNPDLIEAVSYTHLDVYKRQVINLVDSCHTDVLDDA